MKNRNLKVNEKEIINNWIKKAEEGSCLTATIPILDPLENKGPLEDKTDEDIEIEMKRTSLGLQLKLTLGRFGTMATTLKTQLNKQQIDCKIYNASNQLCMGKPSVLVSNKEDIKKAFILLSEMFPECLNHIQKNFSTSSVSADNQNNCFSTTPYFQKQKQETSKNNDHDLTTIDNWITEAEKRKPLLGKTLDEKGNSILIEMKLESEELKLKLTFDKDPTPTIRTIKDWMWSMRIKYEAQNTHQLFISDKQNIKSTFILLKEKIPGFITDFKPTNQVASFSLNEYISDLISHTRAQQKTQTLIPDQSKRENNEDEENHPNKRRKINPTL